MKITKMNNFGSFGVFVDDSNISKTTDEEWMELGKLFVDELVVIFRNIDMNKQQFLDSISKWGPPKSNIKMHFYKKYGAALDAADPSSWGAADDEDLAWLKGRSTQIEETGDGRYVTRITGRKDENGKMLGYFSHGEVGWHSNESSSLLFSPAVALLGWESMEDSATCFVQTVDLYENLEESFRSELDEMVLVHKYIPGRLNENEFTDPDLALHMKKAFCPVDGSETPLVIQAPNGRKGIRYTVNSTAGIKGMSDKETQEIFNKLDKLIFDEKWIHNHWYVKDRKDLMCFDNSVALHKRIGVGKEDRKAFRQQFDLSPLLKKAWEPWKDSPEYHETYKKDLTSLVSFSSPDLRERIKLP